ncbi:MAG: uroporphyrinogen-III synthase [Saprospiraceae bacterium]
MPKSETLQYKESHLPIKTILISQPKPERSAYFDLAKKWNLQIDWRPFIHVEPVAEREFRKNRIRPEDFSAIIFTSKNSIDHFFRICEAMRCDMPQSTKYFCITKAIADYLQKFIVYRKRKVFVGIRKIEDLETSFLKHREEKFLLPCSNLGAKDVVSFLEKNNLDYSDAMMFKTVSSDLSDLSNVKYDVLVFFSPLGIESLYENFPNFSQKKTRMAIFGNSTKSAVERKGLYINILAPLPEVPSMTVALKNYLKKSNKKS